MDRIAEWLRRAWYLLNRRRIEAALKREMETHRAEMGTPTRFGNMLRLREEARDVWGWRWLDDAGRDLALGMRTLARAPGFALTAILILSLGVGINLAFFQLVNASFLQPLRVKDPGSLVYFHLQSRGSDSSSVPYQIAAFVRDNNSVLSAVLLSRWATVAWGDEGGERVVGAFVSANFFDELGAAPAAGRLLREAVDGAPDSSAVVVLSHGFWQRRLGGRADVVGSTVRVNDRPVSVVGIAKADFPGLDFDDCQIWMPIEQIESFQPGSLARSNWSSGHVNLYGRLRPGISAAAAKAGLQATLDTLSRIQPEVVTGQWLEPFSGEVRFQHPSERREVWSIVLGVGVLTALVLMIACLNLSNLTLARAIARVREMSIRTALGAGRWRVMRHLAIESCLVACAGAFVGLLMGIGTASLFVSIAELPPYLSVAPDWRTILAAVGAALVSALVVGLVPAWRIGQQDLALATRDGGERASHGLQAARLRHWLVAGQVAGSCILLVFAGQMARGLQRLLASDHGFHFEQVAVLDPSLDTFGITGGTVPAYWQTVRAIVGAHPETQQMTLVNFAPLGSGSSTSSYRTGPTFRVMDVDASFFSTMRIPMLAGRTFDAHEDRDAAVIISRRGALAMYGTVDVLGLGFPKGEQNRKIVGIAGDARLFSIQASDMAELYQPLLPQHAGAMLIRATADPARLVAPLRSAARAADARVVPEVRLMRDDFNRALRVPRLASSIAGLTGILALGLACVGIFGIVSHSASLRTKEIGIRMALGANGGSIVRTLLRHTLWSGGLGMSLGFVGGWPAGAVFAGPPLYLQPLDVTAYAAAALILVIAGSTAALLPTFRTLRRDPLRALRYD